MFQEGDTNQNMDTPEENQKSNTFRICGNSFVLISESFLLFILLLIFLHSKLHGEHALVDLL
jgi:hypothetical protein